jgi:hypothetical protein
MDETEILLKYCEEHWAQARQSEDQRAVFSNIILLIASAILGILSGKQLHSDVLPLSILLIVLGVFGALTSEKLYERFSYESSRAKIYGDRIFELCPDEKLDITKRLGLSDHKKKNSFLYGIHLHYLWLALHVSVSLAGIILTLIILFSSP